MIDGIRWGDTSDGGAKASSSTYASGVRIADSGVLILICRWSADPQLLDGHPRVLSRVLISSVISRRYGKPVGAVWASLSTSAKVLSIS